MPASVVIIGKGETIAIEERGFATNKLLPRQLNFSDGLLTFNGVAMGWVA